MSETPDKAQFDVPAQILPSVIGPVAAKLLAKDTLLLFDGETATLASANDAAILQLGLDLDTPIQPVFAEMIAGGEAEPETIWTKLEAGEDCLFDGTINGALGLSVDASICATPCIDPDGKSFVLVQAAEKADPGADASRDTSTAQQIESAVGTIIFDMDGNILSMNERAQSVMEDYGEELVGRNHDTIWPKDVCGSEMYIEFWDRMRNGRVMEGKYLHLSAVGSEVWLQCTYTPIKDVSGHPIKVLQTLIDVTKDAYAAAKAQEKADAVWSGMLTCEMSADGHVTDMNQLMAEVLGHEPDVAIGMHDHDFCEKSFALSAAYVAAWEDLAEGKPQQIHIRQKTSEQKLLWLNATLVPVMNAANQLFKVIKVAIDVTDSFDEYLDSSALLKASDPMVGRLEMDSGGKIIKATKYASDAFRFVDEEILGRNLKDICSESMRRPLVYDELWRKLHEGEGLQDRFEMVDAKAAPVWVNALFQPLFSQNGKFAKVVMFFIDRTRTHIAQAKLEERMRSIDGTQVMVEYKPDGTIKDANDRFFQLFEYSRDDVIGKKVGTLKQHTPELVDSLRNMWERLGRGETQTGVFRHAGSDGKDVWLRGAYTPIKDPKGGVSGIILFASDITAEKVRDLELTFKLDALSDSQAVVEFDTSGNVLHANEAYLKTYGYTLREIVGQHHSIFCTPDYVQTKEYRAFWVDLAKGEESHGRVRRLGRFDRDVYLYAHYKPILDIDGEVVKIIKSAIDISDLVQLELQMQESSTQITNRLANTTKAGSDISQNAASLVRSTEETKQSTVESNKQLHDTIETFNAVSKEVSQLTEVVEVISEIAVQTNLLAFNAAIEAARAGEHGVGFSIVADEVRKLAERNSQAARGIGQNIQKATSQIDQGTTNARFIQEMMEKQSDTLTTTVQALDQIATLTSTQTQAMQEADEIVSELKNAVSKD